MLTRKCIARICLAQFYCGFLFVLFALFPAHASELVSFPSLDKKTRLTAYLAKPGGPGPFPLVGPKSAVRDDAQKRLLEFLKKYLLPEKPG
ncbi:hypothetical protein GQF03_14405 [Sneathiella chungangensis]|uniref:Uncharacterized protein n=1 Tax=Sneathiella chungangensis TaxID=1418234 RepID=A0A845MJT6_9PROT|nr:hypothetical protein [Sneathiella chungangensis]MZR23527.1 hypothetical protein [Sneathiella chungangensis]